MKTKQKKLFYINDNLGNDINSLVKVELDTFSIKKYIHKPKQLYAMGKMWKYYGRYLIYGERVSGSTNLIKNIMKYIYRTSNVKKTCILTSAYRVKDYNDVVSNNTCTCSIFSEELLIKALKEEKYDNDNQLLLVIDSAYYCENKLKCTISKHFYDIMHMSYFGVIPIISTDIPYIICPATRNFFRYDIFITNCNGFILRKIYDYFMKDIDFKFYTFEEIKSMVNQLDKYEYLYYQNGQKNIDDAIKFYRSKKFINNN